jgi:hypothetical protein
MYAAFRAIDYQGRIYSGRETLNLENPLPFPKRYHQHYELRFLSEETSKIHVLHLQRRQAMYACIPENGGGFFEAVCPPSNATANSSDPPPPLSANEPEPWQWGFGSERVTRRATVGGALPWGKRKPPP